MTGKFISIRRFVLFLGCCAMLAIAISRWQSADTSVPVNPSDLDSSLEGQQTGLGGMTSDGAHSAEEILTGQNTFKDLVILGRQDRTAADQLIWEQFRSSYGTDGWTSSVLEAVRNGTLRIDTSSPETKRRVNALFTPGATVEQFEEAVQIGLIDLNDRSLAMSVISRNDDQSEDMVLEKLKVLRNYSGELKPFEPPSVDLYESLPREIQGQIPKGSFDGVRVSNEKPNRSFEKAVTLGMPRVVGYLNTSGVGPVDSDKAWEGLLKSGRGKQLETARLLLDLGYLPGASVTGMVQELDLQAARPELFGLLTPYVSP